MAGRQDIEAGKAYVSLYVNQSALVKGLRAAGQHMQSFGANVAKIGVRMSAIGGAMSLPFIGAIRAASDMEETMSKFSVVFGESADAVKLWSDDLAGSVGRSKQQIASFMAGSQDLFVPLGFAADAATDLSKQITTLAIDLGSFNNMADEDVMRDLQAALTGSGEVMKKYGVIVSEAAVKQELLNQGLDPKTATDQMKVQARLNLIMRGTTAAQGDAIRTSGGFANQMKALEGNIKDAAVAIGAALLPVVTPLVTKISAIIKIMGAWVVNNAALVKTAALVAAGIAAAGFALVAFGGTISVLGAALGGIAGLLSGIAGLFAMIVSPIGLVVAGVAAATAAFITFTDTGSWLADTLMGDFGVAFDTVKQTIGGISDALAAGDIALAAEIAMVGLKAAFFEATNTIRTVWIDFNKGLVEGLANASKAVLDIWRKTSQTLSEWFADLGYKTTLFMTGQKDYLTDDESNQVRNSALNNYYDTVQGSMEGGIDSLAQGLTEDLDAQLKAGEDRIQALKDELAALRGTATEKATVARAARDAAPEATKPGDAKVAMGAGMSAPSTSAATFSSAALAALGQGGGPMDKLVKVNEDQKKIAERQLKAADEATASLRKMEALLTVS